MLTKTLKFDDDVLEIIRGMEWEKDGKIGKLACGQLDRAMYEKVNKALVSMGGKWNRSAGGHVFALDPRGQVEGLLESGTLTTEKDGFFETPKAVVKMMFDLVPLPKSDDATILEPSAGLGAIARHLRGRLTLIEKNPQRCKELERQFDRVICMDFLAYLPENGKFDLIYMNPPFENGQDVDHVIHAHRCLANGGIMVSVMCEGPFFRRDRKSREFRQWLQIWHGYSESLPAESFRASGTDINARLVRIAK